MRCRSTDCRHNCLASGCTCGRRHHRRRIEKFLRSRRCSAKFSRSILRHERICAWSGAFILRAAYICQQALLAGRIDMYVEYTGTALTAILHDPLEKDPSAVFARVQSRVKRRFGLEVMPSLGFDNTFAIVIRGEDARRLHLKTLSEAAQYTPQWRAGFGYEFMERPDGYPGLAQHIRIAVCCASPNLDLGLLYRALLDKQVDLVAGKFHRRIAVRSRFGGPGRRQTLFPALRSSPHCAPGFLCRYPEARGAIVELAGKISDQEMRKMNYEVEANLET